MVMAAAFWGRVRGCWRLGMLGVANLIFVIPAPAGMPEERRGRTELRHTRLDSGLRRNDG